MTETNLETGDAIADRLRLALSAESDGAMSRVLGVSPATVSSWRNRDSRPYALCIELARTRGLSLDWLLTGVGEMCRAALVPVDSGGADQPSVVVPNALAADGRRVSALLDVLADLDQGSRDAVLSDCFARATTAQQLSELRKAVRDLEAKKRA